MSASTIRSLLATTPLPDLDRDLLLGHVLGQDRVFILSHPERAVTPLEARRFRALARKREHHEPLAYLVGHKEFYGREFLVNRHTLIPRPETEMLIEEALRELRDSESPTDVVDVGTGSGCIVITLALETIGKRNIFFFGSDISKPALGVARKNCQHLAKEKKISFHHGDLLAHFIKKNYLSSRSLVITANLPYVSPKLFRSVSEEVRREPSNALVSMRHGLDHYARLLHQIKKNCFRKDVTLFLEISPEQKIRLSIMVTTLFPAATLSFHQDLSGRFRVAIIKIGSG